MTNRHISSTIRHSASKPAFEVPLTTLTNTAPASFNLYTTSMRALTSCALLHPARTKGVMSPGGKLIPRR